MIPSRASTSAAGRVGQAIRYGWHAWALRLSLLVLLGWQVLHANREGATVAAQGFVVTLVPTLVSRFSRWNVPWQLELTFVLAMVLQYGSESLKLFELLTYWDKIVHPAEIFFAAGLATFLFVGYRDLHRLEIPDGLAAAGAMLFGMTLGATWELLEFALDWFGNANLQKSNADTMTDILTNDVGAIFGALLAFWLYRHRTTAAQRQSCGRIADWLTARLARLFAEHGLRIGILFGLVVGAIVLAGWLVDRPPPPPPPGLGRPGAWHFDPNGLPDRVAPLIGDWQPDPRGVCRVNPERPLPGSERYGLLALEPGAGFAPRAAYRLSARVYPERPPLGAGTAMEVGLAFGLRGPADFYLVQLSALHDVLVLRRYLHGHVRDQREVRLRTRGDEWHTLAIRVQDDAVAVSADDRPIFEARGLVETAGGVALWARVTAAGCFQDAELQPA